MKKKKDEYITYFTPEYIYIPFDNQDLLSFNNNMEVYNNSYLGKRTNGENIFSPVSGTIIGMKDMAFNGYKSKAIVIENNFIDKREKLNPNKNINKIKKADIIASLEKYNLMKKINSKTILVVNSNYDKKYDLKDVVINVESYEEILEAIDEFMNIFNMKNCYIYINRNDLLSINAYEKYINAFLNICIVHSNRRFKDSTCVFYSIEEILAIHKAIHLDYMYDNTIITINDSKPIVVKVKIYSLLTELLKALKITYRSKKIFVNDTIVDNINDFVIDSTVRSVIIKDK